MHFEAIDGCDLIRQISVGRMIFNQVKQKGVIDRSQPLVKLSFHRNLPYNAVKKRCIEAMWMEQDDESSSYYIADGSGVSIEKEELELICEDGTTRKKISWTLDNYLQVSHKYPSKTRLYCVKIPKGMY